MEEKKKVYLVYFSDIVERLFSSKDKAQWYIDHCDRTLFDCYDIIEREID